MLFWKIAPSLFSLLMLFSSTGFLSGICAAEFQAPPIEVPQGYVVELVAAPPLVKHPMMATFDDRGRLFIAESSGKNLSREDLEKELPNFIRMIEDTDGDGRFDRSTIFADRMTLPMGALWHEGALYVASPPNIWRLEDTNGDGVADRREVIVDKFGYSGNAASIHGCFLGPGGRIYWCDGRHGHQFKSPDGRTVSQGKAARIFSCRADGSDVQIHCGGGMDNPVEIDFSPEGEMLGDVNLFYRQRGDCLVHWMHGGVYPRIDQPEVLKEFRRTGDLMSEVLNLGHVAVSGMMRYRGTHLGRQFQGDYFITQFNTHKVVRTKVSREGSTFVAQAEDFFTAKSNDFHPTDVLEDADGSLLVIDTGGWFRIGCPTSQIAKPDISGAIYRIRKINGSKTEDPRGLKIDWNGADFSRLAGLLSDRRFVVRERAIATLAQRGDSSLQALSDISKSKKTQVRRDVVWTLTRIGSSAAKVALRLMLQDADESVRQAAVHGVGILRDGEAISFLKKLVVSDKPAIRREAATVLGKIGDPSAVPALLAAAQLDMDRVMEHALIYALIEIDDPAAIFLGLKSRHPAVRRSALIALDQIDSQLLTREQIAVLLDTDDFRLQSTVLEIVSRRPRWAEETVGLLQQWLAQDKLSPEETVVVRGTLLTMSDNRRVQELIADKLSDRQAAVEVKKLLLEMIARSRFKTLPEAWISPLAKLLNDRDAALLRYTIRAVATEDSNHFDRKLLTIVRDSSLPEDLRVAALAVIVPRGQSLEEDLFRLLVKQLSRAPLPIDRLSAAQTLGATKLSRRQLHRLTGYVAEAGPLELPSLVHAFESTSDPEVGGKLVDALIKSPGLKSIPAQQISLLLKPFPKNVQDRANAIYQTLQVDPEQTQRQLAELQAKLIGGDVSRGREVLLSQKTACVTCHQVGGQGGKVGPDLSTIGQRRSRRDLLEAIVFPSASFARGFESYTILTVAGKIFTGVILRETAEELFLRTVDQNEIRIARAEIEEMAPSQESVMPQGLERTMSDEQLRDLLAYLQSLK